MKETWKRIAMSSCPVSYVVILFALNVNHNVPRDYIFVVLLYIIGQNGRMIQWRYKFTCQLELNNAIQRR